MVKIIVDREITVTGELPTETEQYIQKRLTFRNPEYEAAVKHGRWTKNIAVNLNFMKKTFDGIKIPRGFSAQLLKILRYNQISYTVEEKTRLLDEVDFSFIGTPYDFQARAVEIIAKRRFGILSSPTGSGKTIIALHLIAERKQPTLIICHTKELLYQWRDRAMEFLGLKKEQIGLIGDGNKDINEKAKSLTIAIINTLYKCIYDVCETFGFIIVDECHRTPSRTFTQVIDKFDSRYMLGLSATAYRRDGLTRVIYFYLGDCVHDIAPQELQKLNKIMQAELVIRPTAFDSTRDSSEEYQAMITDLTENYQRNAQIVEDVLKEVEAKTGVCLVLSDRKQHCETLLNMIIRAGHPVELLTGSTPKKQRQKIVRDLEQGLVEILIATGSLIGEGFDCKRLNSLFMATPVKFSGRVIQYLGRILRAADGKISPKVYDYLDLPGVLQSSFRSRCHAYETMGVIVGESFSFEI